MKNLYRKILTWLFIKTIAPKVKLQFNPHIFCFEFPSDTIYYNFDLDDEPFIENLINYHCHEPRLSLYTYSILHELGHYFMDDCVIYEYENEIAIRNYCAQFSKEEFESNEHLQNLYYHLPSEVEATEWAIDYFNKNKLHCYLFNFFLFL